MSKSVTQTENMSFLCDSRMVSNVSILASDVSEEIVSGASFTTVANEPDHQKSESNDSITAIKSTESCKSFESSNFSQSGNDFNNMNKEPDMFLDSYKFQTRDDINLNILNSKPTSPPPLGEDCVDDIENTNSGDHSDMNLNILEKEDSILNSVIDSNNHSPENNFVSIDIENPEERIDTCDIEIKDDTSTSRIIENYSEEPIVVSLVSKS